MSSKLELDCSGVSYEREIAASFAWDRCRSGRSRVYPHERGYEMSDRLCAADPRFGCCRRSRGSRGTRAATGRASSRQVRQPRATILECRTRANDAAISGRQSDSKSDRFIPVVLSCGAWNSPQTCRRSRQSIIAERRPVPAKWPKGSRRGQSKLGCSN
jgi:hypothetical protein